MSISLTRILQQITGLNTFFAGPSASRDNGVVLLDTATVTWGTDGQGNIQATSSGGSLPTGSANQVVATPDGSSGVAALRALVPADLPVGSASQKGALQVDGTTLQATAGVASVVAPAALVLISKQVLGAPAATVNFGSIPQTYTHLKLVISGASSNASNTDNVHVQFNGDTAAHYTWQLMFGSGNTASAAFLDALGTSIITCEVPGTTAGTIAGIIEGTIPNYAGTIFSKMIVTHGGANSSTVTIDYLDYIGSWSSTAAINAIAFTLQSGGNFVAGSTFSLYGVQ